MTDLEPLANLKAAIAAVDAALARIDAAVANTDRATYARVRRQYERRREGLLDQARDQARNLRRRAAELAERLSAEPEAVAEQDALEAEQAFLVHVAETAPEDAEATIQRTRASLAARRVEWDRQSAEAAAIEAAVEGVDEPGEPDVRDGGSAPSRE